MCGIFGIVNFFSKQVDSTELTAGIRALNHRGPDYFGVFRKDQIGLANCRLSIIDPDNRANQPLCYQNLWITYNGCIFNYLEIKSTLRENGYIFTTKSDTEVILAAYHLWGKDCVGRFNGMWAFCIYDPQQNILFCSRDRFGIKPFYYTLTQSGFYFASEIKSFTHIHSWSNFLNQNRGADFILYGLQDHTHETFFDHVYQLPPSHNLVYNLDTHQYTIKRYYDIENYKKLDFVSGQAVTGFRELFFDSIRLRLRADVRIGACLSGGLDSSSLLTAVSELNDHSTDLLSVSVYYNQKGFDERPFIHAISSKTKIPNISFCPSLDELESDLDNLIYTLDEPPGSAGMYAQNKLFSMAKSNKLKVMLDGQGGDEILGGYDIFYFRQFQWLQKESNLLFLRAFLNFLKNYRNSYGALWKRYLNYSAKDNPRPVKWLNLDTSSDVPELNKTYGSISDVTISLFQGMGLQALLHFEDRNSMAHSIESRLPFLDHRLVEYCLGLPDEYKLHRGERKFILRQAMKNLLPESIYSRKDKMGFEIPQSQWIRKNYPRIMKEVKEDIKEIPLYNQASFPDSISHTQLWRIYVFNRWMKIFDVE